MKIEKFTELFSKGSKLLDSDSRQIKDQELQKMKSVIDAAFQMNSRFIDFDELDQSCWIKEYVRYDRTKDITAYTLGIETEVNGLGYFDILLTHIASSEEKNLTIDFFDLDEGIVDLIENTSETELMDSLRNNYNNVFLNFNSGTSFSFFEPQKVDVPSIAGGLNIKV